MPSLQSSKPLLTKHITLPTLLRLPLELRQHIYSYLLPREDVLHPLPLAGLTSVSHRPPAAALLNIHPTITREILEYFYIITTWKVVFSHCCTFFRADHDLRRLEQSPSLQRIRQVEMVFFCDDALLQSRPSPDVPADNSTPREIVRRAARACAVFARAARLRSVVVSWCDTVRSGSWADKALILAPLRALRERSRGFALAVTFRVGDVYGEDAVGRRAFAKALQDVLGIRDRLESRTESGDAAQSCNYRSLAMRQDKRMFFTHPGSYPMSTVRRSGWRGAPPSLAVPIEET